MYLFGVGLHVEQRKPIEDSDLRILAEHINTSWDTVAFLLDITISDEMSKLKILDDVDAAHSILRQWYINFTGINPHQQLFEHLLRFDPALAHHFKQGTLNTYQSTSRKRFL